MQYASKTKSNKSLFDAIHRGRQALSQAENHIQSFEKFLSESNSCQESTNNIVASFHDVETPSKSEGSHDEISEVDAHSVYDQSDDSRLQTTESVGFLDRPIEIDNSVAKLSSEYTRVTHNVSAIQSENQNTKKTQKRRSFDPARLYKQNKQRECLTKSQGNEYEFSQFKALPLPGGASVSNDPYALTKAAQSKIIKKQLYDNPKRFDASLLLNGDSRNSEFASDNGDCQINSSKRKTEIDEIYKAATKYVQSTFTNGTDESDDEEEDAKLSYENIETVKGLQMEIARLKAQLRCKKMKCIETIQEIGQEAPNKTIDEILGVSMENDALIKGDKVPDKHGQNNDEQCESLYVRQLKWDKNRINKVQSIRETIEKDILKTITSRPQIHHGKKSWLESKNAHDKLMLEANEREMQLQAEREENERITQKRRMEESANILRLAKEKVRSLKQNVDKNHQIEYADRLSRSKRRETNVSANVDRASVTEIEDDDNARTEKDVQSPFLSGKKRSSNKPKSFAEMDDQEFAKMIKDIQVQAKKKSRNEAKSHKRQIETGVALKTLERKVNLSPYH